MNEDTHVQYSELFEFWIPEEYADLIDQSKKYIF
jgi:E3 ubiquitin-protein ligase HUWE1